MRKTSVFVVIFFATAVNPQFVSDVLSPYEEGRHGSVHRSVRSVSNCQAEDWGNGTVDQYDLQIPVPVPQSASLRYDVFRFADKVRSNQQNIYSIHRKRYVLGSIAFLHDPYYTMSVMEPQKPGGCEVKYFSASRATVRETTHNRVNGCVVAVNAGYFSMRNGRCLGNVVADGRVVSVSEEMNANFGIRQDGSVVVGYIPAEEVREGVFRQLVSGVIWLVRNGTSYVNESMQVECAANQDTGKMATFVNVLSARTALGIDEKGRVVVAQVNGQTHARGVNLYEFADILIAHGVVSAINLDGGGSSTFLHRDVLINYPSDHCQGNPAYRCERSVSTAICFHRLQCLEPTCSNHGNCVNGQCVCTSPWTGRDCSLLNCTHENCSGHGNCSEGSCDCRAGWGGERCGEECSSSTYGPGCRFRCRCYGRSLCNTTSGGCFCPPGYTGLSCWRRCAHGFYGDGCSMRCPTHNCSGHGTCSHTDGTCVCTGNWTGTTCNQTRTDLLGTNTIVSLGIRTSTVGPSTSGDPSPRQPVFRTNTVGPGTYGDPSPQSVPTSTVVISLSSTSTNERLASETVGPPCETGPHNRTSSITNWPYRYLLLGSLLSLSISIAIHILVCVRIRTCRHDNSGSANTRLLSSRQGKQRRKKRKRTQVPLYSSSSDCSI